MVDGNAANMKLDPELPRVILNYDNSNVFYFNIIYLLLAIEHEWQIF